MTRSWHSTAQGLHAWPWHARTNSCNPVSIAMVPARAIAVVFHTHCSHQYGYMRTTSNQHASSCQEAPPRLWCCSMIKKAVPNDTTSNLARFKQLYVHLLNCGDHNCALPGCLAGRDVLCCATECRDCQRVGRGCLW
jgi:hypothetical protein